MKTENTPVRIVLPFDEGWTFSRGDPAGAQSPEFNDSDWEKLDVPHDWAISGPFDRNNDIHKLAIIEDGETKENEHTGRTGGLPHVGTAWYRKSFAVPEMYSFKSFAIEFDGVMSNSSVYLNGEFAGTWPYGYSSFSFDLKNKIRIGAKNVIAVRIETWPLASRWYPGAGIYRHVRMVVTNPIHVAHWGTYITTPHVSDESATVSIRTEVRNDSGSAGPVTVTTSILNDQGSAVDGAIVSSEIRATATAACEQEVSIENPYRWDTKSPRMYTALTELIDDSGVVDRYETRFGVRTLEFDAKKGFSLNGRNFKLQGVCMHHDLGPLGAAVNTSAIRRQYELLKEMGCNALRTAHNPAAPEVLDICDELGLLVISESFDEWAAVKCQNGYNRLFNEWAEKDMRALIRRDRNHPCVFMWSIGNEVPEQGLENGGEVASFLTQICHDEDPSRPVTAAFNGPDAAIENGLADAIDIQGWNYQARNYGKFSKEYPDWIQLGIETESCVSTRGAYYFPAEIETDPIRPSLQVSSYGLSSPGWGYYPDLEFKGQDENPNILGQFVWTGFDYLGEPTPYKLEWPSRSSYFGIIDLCGFPKNRYYLYKSRWSSSETLHLLPHWNWEGRDGEITPVHCYTNCDAVELFVNGVSQGLRRKDPSTLLDRYRLRWNEVRYEPGVVKAVAFDPAGKPCAETEIKTAGKPARIELDPDRRRISVDGKELCFVTVKICDKDGILCPLADNLVRFKLSGAGKIAAVGNGDPTSMDPFIADYRKAFHGMCLLIVAATWDAQTSAGEGIRITPSSEGLAAEELLIGID